MSVNYYCKVVKKDNSEVISSIDVGWQIRDYVVSNPELICEYPDESKLPNYIVSKNERNNKLLIGWTSAEVFFDETIRKLETENEKTEVQIKILESKILISKTKAVYDKIEQDIEFLKMEMDHNKELIDAFSYLEFAVNYELNHRMCYKNNKVVELDKEYKFRDIKDYNLFFFWS